MENDPYVCDGLSIQTSLFSKGLSLLLATAEGTQHDEQLAQVSEPRLEPLPGREQKSNTVLDKLKR